MKYSLMILVSAAIALNLFTFIIVPAVADPLLNTDLLDLDTTSGGVFAPENPCPTPDATFQASAEGETPTEQPVADETAIEIPAETIIETPVEAPPDTPIEPPTNEVPAETPPDSSLPLTEDVPTEPTEAIVEAPTDSTPTTEESAPVEPCVTTTPQETPAEPVVEPEVSLPVPAGEELSDTVADVPEFVEEAPQIITGPVNVSFSVTGAPLSTLVFYRVGDSTFSLSTGIGDDPVVMPRNFFTPGEYIIVDTRHINGCASMSLNECRAAAGYLGESSFKI